MTKANNNSFTTPQSKDTEQKSFAPPISATPQNSQSTQTTTSNQESQNINTPLTAKPNDQK